VPPDFLQVADKLLPSMSDLLSIEDGDTVRSSSQRPTHKTSASASKDYISVTPGKYEEGFLSEDYVTLTGNTNSSSDADFLADMFDRTAQVYRHHLRAVAHADLVMDNCKTALDI